MLYIPLLVTQPTGVRTFQRQLDAGQVIDVVGLYSMDVTQHVGVTSLVHQDNCLHNGSNEMTPTMLLHMGRSSFTLSYFLRNRASKLNNPMIHSDLVLKYENR